MGRMQRAGRFVDTRRGLVRGAVSGALATAIAAPLIVTATAGSGPAGAASSVNPNGVLKYGFDLNSTFGNDFDPATQTSDCSYTMSANIMQSMTAPGNFFIGGGVAQSWTVAPNSEQITFKLRPGLVFSNGQPVTSNDVKVSLLNTETSPLRSSLTAIANIQTPDPQTVVVNLNRPTAGDFLWAMSYIDGQIYPANQPNMQLQPVGSGPYVVQSTSQGQSVVLTKNPKYYNSAAYPLAGINFTQVTNGPQAATALTSGAVDMIPVEPANYQQLKNAPNIGISITKSYDNIAIELRMNTGPFANPKVRAALQYAVDRNALNRVVYNGLGEPAFQPVPSWSAGYNKSLGNKYGYNPAKAKALLKAAGFPNGVSFSLVSIAGEATFQRAAALLQAEMAPAGFRANINQINPADLLVNVYLHGQGDALLSELLTNGPDMTNNFESLYEPQGFPAQHLGSVNTQLAGLIQQANSSLSASVQGPLTQQIDAIIMQQGLLVPLVFEPSIVAYNKNRVGGRVVAPIGQCRSNLAGIYIKK